MPNNQNPEKNDELRRFIRLAISQDIDPDRLRMPTAKELAEKSNGKLTLGEIQALLRGEFPTFSKYRTKLEGLAEALDLSERQKETLFAKAGLLYQPKPKLTNVDALLEIIRDLRLPATIRTPLLDYIGFNAAYREVDAFTDEHIEKLSNGKFGANQLRITFDPSFSNRVVSVNDRWKIEAVEVFRSLSFPYIGTKRFQEILEGANEFKDFRVLWSLTSSADKLENDLFGKTTNHLIHPTYGKLSTLSLRVPPVYLPPTLIVSVYVPIGETTEQIFAQHIMSKPLKVYRFENRLMEL